MKNKGLIIAALAAVGIFIVPKLFANNNTNTGTGSSGSGNTGTGSSSSGNTGAGSGGGGNTGTGSGGTVTYNYPIFYMVYHPDVKLLQNALEVATDGVIGPITANALKKYGIIFTNFSQIANRATLDLYVKQIKLQKSNGGGFNPTNCPPGKMNCLQTDSNNINTDKRIGFVC